MKADSIENAASLKTLLEQIDRLKSEIDAMRPLSPEQEARVMQKFRLDWNYHSNSIEGNSLTYGETIAFLMEGLTAKGKPFKDHLDIKGHNEAINYLMDLVKKRDRVGEKEIRELHKMTLVESYRTKAKTPDGQSTSKEVTLGAYKTQPNHVKTPTSETHYYATPEETPAKMEELMAWLREHQEKADIHPLVLAAIFHYRFVAIHPFDDGNGRMSRLLMNLLLMQYGYPPVVIKQQERNGYYYALRQADAGDLLPFVEFVGENLLHSLDIQLRGARGESIEEEDDLDKEIALLKGSFEDGKDVIAKSKEVLKTVLFQSMLPLYREVQNQSRKLDDLFFKSKDIVWYGKSNENGTTSLDVNKWNEVISWANGEYFKQQIGEMLQWFNYEYNWVNFKKSDETFDVRCILKAEFKPFKYEIELIGYYEKTKIIKLYSEILSKDELSEISKLFVKEAIAQIKDKTKK